MPRSAANLGLAELRIRGLKTKYFRVFHFVERGCVHAKEHRRRPTRDRAVCVAGETSIRLAQDRQPTAIQNCCRSFLVQQ